MNIKRIKIDKKEKISKNMGGILMREYRKIRKMEKKIEKSKTDWNINQKIESKKGITLIALVVTIIILLILAGITITTVLGDNGVIELAKQAKKETIVTTVKEAIDIAKLSKSLEKEDGMITEDELKEILENYGKIRWRSYRGDSRKTRRL